MPARVKTPPEMIQEIAARRAENFDLDSLIDIAHHAEAKALQKLSYAEVRTIYREEIKGDE